MLRALFLIALAVVPNLGHSTAARAGELLQIDGGALKWGRAAPGAGTVVTYAVLTGAYTVPGDRSTLSPDNCGAMHSFASIIAQSPGISLDMAKAELRAAFAVWEAVADITFVEVDDISRANIIAGAADKPEGRAYANLSYRNQGVPHAAKALGQSGPDLPAGSSAPAGDTAVDIEQAYVCLSPRPKWKAGFDGNLNVYDLRHTFTHEIGHAIGLDHPGSSGAIMAYRYDERVRQLQPSDIAAAQKLYGPRRREE